MNTGIFGEGFPYSNFHDLNMDWIIKIAKDFLDQYTTIQQTITEGLEGISTETAEALETLNNKATEIEGLLNAWYNTHSEDIANQLAEALSTLQNTLTQTINSFSTSASQIAQETIASIPVDYTALYNQVQSIDLKTIQCDKVISTAGALVSPYDDLNTIPQGRIVCYINQIPAHCPVSALGNSASTVLTYNYKNSATLEGGAVQIFVNGNADLYVRYKFANTNNDWTAWKYLINRDFVNASMIRCDKVVNNATTFVAPYDDMNTIPQGTIVSYINKIPAHSPNSSFGSNKLGYTTFTVLTYNYKNSTTLEGGAVQTLVDGLGALWIRYKYANPDSNWSKWNNMVNSDDIATDIPALSVFDKIGIIGDSWSKGTYYTDSSNYVSKTNFEWSSILSKIYGFTKSLFAGNGLTTTSWLTSQDGKTAMQNATAQDLYICFLGINDHAQNHTIGNISDMDDTQSTSFYGSYGAIIRAIKTKAPNAKIAILDLPKYTSSVDVSAYNTAIANIAEHFEIALLKCEDSAFFTSSLYTNSIQWGHPTGEGYCGLAKAIAYLLSKSFANKRTYWRY